MYPVYPQPYPGYYPQPYPPPGQPYYPNPYPGGAGTTIPNYMTTTTTTTLPPDQFPDSTTQDPVIISLRAARQQAVGGGGTFIPLKPGMRPGQQYSIPIIGKIEFTALTNAGIRIEGIAGSNRAEGLSKQRYYIVNDTLVDFVQVREIEVRWTPDQRSQQSFYELNSRRIFVSGVRIVDNAPIRTMALFSRCGRSTELEAVKNYHFRRGCFKFAPADQELIDYYKGTGILCEDINPPIMDKKCIEDESKDYVRLFATPPSVTIPPSSVTTTTAGTINIS
jgi:hypothetical protein